MKNRTLILGVLGVAVVLVAVYFWGPSATPPTQVPLATLSGANLNEFTAAFDTASDAPRLVLLLSPT